MGREANRWGHPDAEKRYLHMKKLTPLIARQDGKLGWIFLWLIGVPIPVLLILFLLRGCT